MSVVEKIIILDIKFLRALFILFLILRLKLIINDLYSLYYNLLQIFL